MGKRLNRRLLLKTTRVFGSSEAAKRWSNEPAIGLDGQRPVELLSSSEGQEMIEISLEEIEHCDFV